MKKTNFKTISIKGARTHNLKNIDIELPLQKITCVYGPSGSGKSSLAFHTILAESKRRYLNSLPNDIKFFWNMPTAAEVDSIYPVLPVWGLAQSNPILGSRPNLADTMGLSEHLQRMWQDYGKEFCPEHREELVPENWDDTFLSLLEMKGWNRDEDVLHFFIERGIYQEKFGSETTPARSYSFEKSDIDTFNSSDLYWEIFRVKIKSLDKVAKKIKEIGLSKDKVLFCVKDRGNLDPLPRQDMLKCKKCDYQKKKVFLEPTEFSPYNAAGACTRCNGHGMNLEYDREKVVKYPYLSIGEGAISILESSHFSHFYPLLVKELKKEKISLTVPFSSLPEKKIWKILEEGLGRYPGLKVCYDYLESKRYKRTVRIFSRKLKSEVLCEDCTGTRVNKKTHDLIIPDFSYFNYKELWLQTPEKLLELLNKTKKNWTDNKLKKRFEAIINLLMVSKDLGLSTIPLWKKAKYLSSSEYQRALLTKILSYQGSGSLFVLDEPSFDLSLDEQTKLYNCLIKIRDQGNTILLVEHSEYLRTCSDFLVEMGPGAGPDGGKIISQKVNRKKALKPPKIKLKKSKKYKENILVKSFKFDGGLFPELKIPLKETTIFYGSSGYRKDHYCKNVILDTLSFISTGEPIGSMKDVDQELISGDFNFEKVLSFDSSLGKVSSRSSVGTSIGLSPEVRKYLANLPISRELGLEKGHFSPNSELGRCTSCEGRGVKEIEMSFLEDIILVCDDCSGKKLKPYLASISDGTFTAYDAFRLPMIDIIPRLSLTPKFQKIWSLVELLNLSYLSLDRSLSSLSGGERMRIKLLSQLSAKIENSFLFFDNISSGLSTKELEKIYDFIDSLKNLGNTVFIVDQNPALIERTSSAISAT
ncbi:MAG: hypothetical protein K9K67_02865 [Bacteriovoracaceae bacterium]|nr:hypothetical protein [Bacteriovoracaceae bacterium]